ncbi:MAG: hypothetical protein AB1592_11380 [Pseudomonadota bacterium]
MGFVHDLAFVGLWLALLAFPFAFCAVWLAVMRRLAPEREPDAKNIILLGWVLSIGLAVLLERELLDPLKGPLD